MENRKSSVRMAWIGSVLRLGGGLNVKRSLGPRPARPLELYEFEACPFCRKVRETLSSLDLEVVVYPCPKGGTRFRPKAVELGGKAQFPLLVDPNTGKQLYESDDINTYLATTYGTGSRPLMVSLGPITMVSSGLASAMRKGHGGQARPSKPPEKRLELWSFEASPYCRLVRERLCELELPYLLHNVAKKSPSRPAFIARSGKMQVPWLVDPNTGTELFESEAIVDYLDKTYGA
ncbi:MAG: glutathione S-transferase N-terminal domain-containing protein [Archangium sp.]|nr:glutathione S-transferase N-terminal domain-containing protein [Archangium sp.]